MKAWPLGSMTSGPIDINQKFLKMQDKMDEIIATENDAKFRWATLDIKEYYDQMTVEAAIDTVNEGFDIVRNDGEFFSIDRQALYKSNLMQLNNKAAVKKLIK